MEKIIEKVGVKFYANTELEQWRAETILEKEPETIAWLNSFALKEQVFYDIGANVGSYSIYAAIVNKDLSVFSFEPVQENYCALVKNIQLNNAENIHAFRLALSNKNNLSDIYLKDSRVGNSGAQIDKPVDERGVHFQQVSIQKILTLSLDSLVSDFSFPPPNFLKIDVDGHEKDVINGMNQLLQSDTLVSLLIEFNSTEELAEYTEHLAKYKLFPDPAFNNHPDHSSYRRQQKNSSAINCVFTKNI